MEELQPHIKLKKGDLHRYVIYPGDPARVRLIAKFFDYPKQIQFNREYLTINGSYKGVPISAVSSGMGCPSTLIGIEEMKNIGAETIIRIGTCGSLKKDVLTGDIIIPSAAIKEDGMMYEQLITIKNAVKPDTQVFNTLLKSSKKFDIEPKTGINRTHDTFYETMEEFLKLKGRDLTSSEMECAGLYFLGNLRKIKTGCILVVNTYEPPEEVEKNPSIVYQLSDQKLVSERMDLAIKIVLEAIFTLETARK